MYYSVLLGTEVVLAFFIILLILVYRGKGADVGAIFSGGAASVFGAKGSVPFTTKLIAILCAMFIINSPALTYLANRPFVDDGVIEMTPVEEVVQPEDKPALPIERETPQDDIPRDPTEGNLTQ